MSGLKQGTIRGSNFNNKVMNLFSVDMVKIVNLMRVQYLKLRRGYLQLGML